MGILKEIIKKNEIVILDSQEMNNGETPVGVIRLGLNLNNSKTIDNFLNDAVNKWVTQRMCSVPHTTVMVVTIQGTLNSIEFKGKWDQYRKNNKILDAFMKMMTSADVMHIKGNVLIDSSSLI